MVEEKIENEGQVPADEEKNIPPSMDELPLTEGKKVIKLSKRKQPHLPGLNPPEKKKQGEDEE